MLLKQKIILSFILSASISVSLILFGYFKFTEIRKDIRFLELSDTIRSKSLQLRRHEKNFFLYGDKKELQSVHDYINQLKNIASLNGIQRKNNHTLKAFEKKILDYELSFEHIETINKTFIERFPMVKHSNPKYKDFYPIIEATLLERPALNADLIGKMFDRSMVDDLLHELLVLGDEIKTLRRVGEDILFISKDLDTEARDKIESAIRKAERAALVLFPLSFFVGIITLFGISQRIASRLRLLNQAVSRTGKGDFTEIVAPNDKDEVGVLINSLNRMEADLRQRDSELNMKNEELLKSRKLASIGTLASGVAHELNNPLNNIYLAAQILSKEIPQDMPPVIRETVDDIFNQTHRVKHIVSELLEFAREKPPDLKQLDLDWLINKVLGQMRAWGELQGISVDIKTEGALEILADGHMMEQMLVNLFSNAADAMHGSGELKVYASVIGDAVVVKVSDTGEGISKENLGRIFDPFFTTKEKGTGLGLAIAYNIIVKHNGKVDVESTSGKGTAVTITLPIMK